MGERAECVMLNKGPYAVDAVRVLDDVLRRMEPIPRRNGPCCGPSMWHSGTAPGKWTHNTMIGRKPGTMGLPNPSRKLRSVLDVGAGNASGTPVP